MTSSTTYYWLDPVSMQIESEHLERVKAARCRLDMALQSDDELEILAAVRALDELADTDVAGQFQQVFVSINKNIG